ncbi:MAG: PEP-CTERM sorting domain-containing protein [Planctomycetota bacterium]
MRRTSQLLGLAIVVAVVSSAAATPLIDSAIINTRLWNDDADSVLTTSNLYPSLISIQDAVLDGDGAGGEWANRHNFRLSANGGISEAVFMNDDAFEFYADVTITGPANSEGGLNLAPWWSQPYDGVFMANAASGEVACFGGRLPFYSFTSNHGMNYVKGTTVRMGLIYDPNSLTELDPGTIEYLYTDTDNTTYSSGILPFDMGNPAEDPPYGLWGILNDARLGGYFLPQIDVGNPDNWGQIDFGNMTYIPEPASVLLLGLAGLAVLRRR